MRLLAYGFLTAMAIAVSVFVVTKDDAPGADRLRAECRSEPTEVERQTCYEHKVLMPRNADR